jgi:hypothetical protein
VPAEPAGPADTPGAAPVHAAAPGLLDQLTDYLQLIRSQWRQQLQLLTLETQRAAESLVAICVLGLFTALLLLSSWVIVLLIVWTGLAALGLSAWQGLLMLLLLQLLALAICLRQIRYHSHFLRFPATLQSWRDQAPGDTDNKAEPLTEATPCPSHPVS